MAGGMGVMGMMGPMPHPFHIHGGQFQVVRREGVAHTGYVDSGWKDTVLVLPGERATFCRYVDFSGLFLYHCHNLEHEDGGRAPKSSRLRLNGPARSRESPPSLVRGPCVAGWSACGRPRPTCWRRSPSPPARPRVGRSLPDRRVRSRRRGLLWGTRERRRFRHAWRGTRGMGDAMRDAVARGDLNGARPEASSWRSFGSTGLPPSSGRDARRDEAAAARSTGASGLKDAGRDVGLLARTCGDCHTSFGRPGIIVEPPGDCAPGPGQHAAPSVGRGAALDALVVPSDDAWNAGALALAEAPLVPEQLTPGKSPVPRVEELAEMVHNLGLKVASAERGDGACRGLWRVARHVRGVSQLAGGGPGPRGSP